VTDEAQSPDRAKGTRNRGMIIRYPIGNDNIL
jgi:hypothetical protein